MPDSTRALRQSRSLLGRASAFDTGQAALASAANFWKSASLRLGTSASQLSSILVMVGPSPRVTVAVV
ncbi:MAG: hypothetical protein R2856_18290 [Caldilineaceae bacterium]